MERAPRSIVSTYVTQNGFGWNLDEIVGAQIVSVPMVVALEQSSRIRNLFICVLISVFLLLIALFNLLPILLITLTRGDKTKRDTTRPRMTDAIRAFGCGLFAAGMVLVLVSYVVTYARGGGLGLQEAYARGGGVGLQEALNPFILSNYASLAAVGPGVVTIWLANCLRRPLSQSPR